MIFRRATPKIIYFPGFFKIYSRISSYFLSNFSGLDFCLDLSLFLLIQAQHIVLVSGGNEYY
ncbi:MAG: hypothetical protein B6230_05145 [Desulfobacteraceae bacterium 4572_89]|nr:MAG: hypothetical protein B6230_05145 [Desulfobacteraceae bacterium 4572_89]